MTERPTPMLLRLHLALLSLVLLLTTWPAVAQQQFVAAYRDWSLFTYEDGDRKLCFIATEPTNQDGNYNRRGDPAMLVTRVAGRAGPGEVSVQPGYAYKEGSEVRVVVDGNRTFQFFTQGEYAWSRGAADDEALIGAMRSGINLTVRGTSTLDTWSEDTYSLLGFTAAAEALTRTCS
ncbi:MAG: invasion associated locus B family protein [Pseudomonadota bacterium]